MNREAGALEDVLKYLWVGEEKMSQTGGMESVGSFPLVSPISLSSYSGCTSWWCTSAISTALGETRPHTCLVELHRGWKRWKEPDTKHEADWPREVGRTEVSLRPEHVAKVWEIEAVKTVQEAQKMCLRLIMETFMIQLLEINNAYN